jgi:hypothetical protein
MQIISSLLSIFIIIFFIKLKNTPKTELLERIKSKLNYPISAEKILSKLRSNRNQLNIPKEDLLDIQILDKLLDYYLLNCPDRAFFHGKKLRNKLDQIIKDVMFNNLLIKTKNGANKRVRNSFSAKERLEFKKSLASKIELSILEYYYFEELLSKEIVPPFYLWNTYQKFRLFLKPKLFDFIKKVRIFVYRKKDLLRPFFCD